MHDGGKREIPIEVYLKFWNWNLVARDTRNPGVDEELRNRKERAGNITRAGRVTRRDSRVPDGEVDDVGIE